MATLDVNGDGFADVLVGSSSAASGAGRAHLYLGGPAGVSTSPIVLAGGGDARGFGYSVASAGDIDGDGYADIIIGAYISASDAGRAYLYRGSADGPSVPPIELDAPDGGYFGQSVASAGDVNRDGYADVIIGAPYVGAQEGRAYLYNGGPGGLSPSPRALDNPGSNLAFGWDVASAGDVDGDGYADVLVGAGADAGQAYLYRGGATGLSSSPTTFDDDAGEFGSSVVCAGDVDGDGYADVLIRSSSRVYLYYGGEGGLSPAMLLRDNTDGYAGVSVDSAGDVNGDGYADVIVGGYIRSSGDGRGYLYKGGASGLSSSPAVLEGTDPGGGPLRGAVAGAGDVEGDGYADFVISGAGGFYLFRGSSTGVAGTPVVLTP